MNSMMLNKIAAAVLLAGVVAMTSGLVTRLIHPAAAGAHHGDHHGDENRVLAAYVKHDDGAGGDENAAPAGPEPISGLLASADIAAGEKIFKKCSACHTAEKGGGKKTGPALYGVVGNDIAARDDFKYTDVLQGLPGDWTYEALNAFLFKPKQYANGTKMNFAGLRKDSDRAAIIAYLRAQDDAPEPLPE